MDDAGNYRCPHCQHQYRDEVAAQQGEYSRLLKKMSQNEKVDLSLLVQSEWLEGASKADDAGIVGGTCVSEVEATRRWNLHRTKTLKLLEVRGKLPEEITWPDSGLV